jgi:hypothetical protein
MNIAQDTNFQRYNFKSLLQRLNPDGLCLNQADNAITTLSVPKT